MSRFQFVFDHSDACPVKWLCDLLEIGRSPFYAWCKAAPIRDRWSAGDDALAKEITAVYENEDASYGAPRITAELNDGKPVGQRVNHKCVERVMRERGIADCRKRRRVRTTVPEPAGQRYPDLMTRKFTAQAPNRAYVGDITYLPSAIPGDDGKAKNLYFATVIDCFSRRLVGWAIADHMRTDLVIDALRAAELERGSVQGGDLPLGPWFGLRIEGLRRSLREHRCHAADGRGGYQCRQCVWQSRSTRRSNARYCAILILAR